MAKIRRIVMLSVRMEIPIDEDDEIEDIVNELNYGFSHPDIPEDKIETEISDYEIVG